MEPLLGEDLVSSELILDVYDNTHINYIYQYFFYGGFNTIVTNQVVRILNSYILIFIINFLTNCVDYNGLLDDINDDIVDRHISDYIHINNWFPHNPYLIICFTLYCIYLLCITVNMVTIINKTQKIRKFYNKDLKIDDSSLKYFSWEQIHSKILNLNTENVNINKNNIYRVSNKVCHNNNLIISIFRSNLFTFPNISKLLEWNFIYCIIDPIHDSVKEATVEYQNLDNTELPDDSYLIHNDITSLSSMNKSTTINESNMTVNHTKLNLNYQTLYSIYLKKVNAKLKLVFVINIIAMPFAIIILGIYLILKYGEKFYHNPKLVYQRQLDIKSKWILRYYNEYPHIYNERIKQLQHNMDSIMSQYQSTIFQIIYRLFVFICGSIFIVLFSLTLLSGNEFANIIIFDNKSILWFLSVLGTFLIVARSGKEEKYISKKEKNEIFDRLCHELVSIDNKLLKDEKDKEHIINLIKEIYPFKLKFILYEIFYLLASPYYLLKWKNQVNYNYQSIMSLLDTDMDLGAVSKSSVFDNSKQIDNDIHMYLSYVSFKQNYQYKFNIDVNFDKMSQSYYDLYNYKNQNSVSIF
jgi:hypothetical protein